MAYHILHVSPIMAFESDDEVRTSYESYMREGKQLFEASGELIVEVIDLRHCKMSFSTVKRLPLLVELLQSGNTEYSHASKTVIVAAPSLFVSTWNMLQKTELSFLKNQTIEFVDHFDFGSK